MQTAPKKPMNDNRRHYLREWRVYRGWTQAELAAKVGAKGAALSRWERRERGIKFAKLLALFAALDITPDQFFTRPPDG